jgi:hypothetical protein
MLSAAEFAKCSGISREAVRVKHLRNGVLDLTGVSGLPFPKWQITALKVRLNVTLMSHCRALAAMKSNEVSNADCRSA